jgi:hypothetical protein
LDFGRWLCWRKEIRTIWSGSWNLLSLELSFRWLSLLW